jgi:hypothetical protein
MKEAEKIVDQLKRAVTGGAWLACRRNSRQITADSNKPSLR